MRIDALRELLATHRTEDAREAAFVERMQALCAAGERALERDHWVPGHFTASAFVLSPDRRQLLLILHSKLGVWLQPGGHVEPGDASLVEAARREIREEVGLAEVTAVGTGILDVDVHDIPPYREVPAHQHFDVRFLFVAPSLAVQAGDDARAARWIALDGPGLGGVSTEADAVLRSDESVLRAVRRIRAMV